MNKIFKIVLLLCLSFLTIYKTSNASNEKIKIGLLIPLTGEDKLLGKLLVQSTQIALEDIGSDKVEIYPRDTASDPKKTLASAIELKELGVQIVIGPIFYKNLVYLNELQSMLFLSLTNKTLNLPNNVISTGVNATSQLNTIKKFIHQSNISK